MQSEAGSLVAGGVVYRRFHQSQNLGAGKSKLSRSRKPRRFDASRRDLRRDFARASWTYDPAGPCYGTMGIEGGIAKEKRQMDRLYDLLSSHGIALSVGVYPWPQQLLYDRQDSRQVQIWRDWCLGKCEHFFNSFPTLFRYKERDPDFLKHLFIWGDSHCTTLCYQIMADDLIGQYRHP